GKCGKHAETYDLFGRRGNAWNARGDIGPGACRELGRCAQFLVGPGRKGAELRDAAGQSLRLLDPIAVLQHADRRLPGCPARLSRLLRLSRVWLWLWPGLSAVRLRIRLRVLSAAAI